MRGNTGGGGPGRRIVRRFACGHLCTWDRRLASPVEHRAVAPFRRQADEKRIHTPRSDSKQRRQDRAFAFGDSSTVGTPAVMTVAPRTDEASRRVPFLTARILRCSLSSYYGVVSFGAHERRKTSFVWLRIHVSSPCMRIRGLQQPALVLRKRGDLRSDWFAFDYGPRARQRPKTFCP